MGAELPFIIDRLSIWVVIGYFVVYIVTHFLVGKILEARELKLKNSIRAEKDLIKEIKFWSIVFKWYPAIYLVFLLLTIQAF